MHPAAQWFSPHPEQARRAVRRRTRACSQNHQVAARPALSEHPTGTCRVVIAIRARKGRTLTFVTKRIDHKEASSLDGSHTNNAESFFARLRRMVRGQHHFVSPKYLRQYATHAAWLEDHRTKSNGALCCRLIRNSLAAPISRDFKGYWQRSVN
jgi:hypothetical protein